MTPDEWRKVEYEELHRYGRTVYESFFRLAQMSFVLNAALGTAFYYVARQELRISMCILATIICIIAMIYNFGALCNYWSSNRFLSTILNAIRSIENTSGGVLCNTLYQFDCGIFTINSNGTIDRAGTRKNISAVLSSARQFGVFGLTVIFFIICIILWISAVIFTWTNFGNSVFK